MIGSSYHFLKKLESFTKWINLSKCHRPITKEQVMEIRDSDDSEDSSHGHGDYTRPSCSGLGNIMYFYFNWVWFMESLTVGGLIYFGRLVR